ncbi:cytotoxic translational repressor of toxin-antitoxin stability system [Geomonas sp. Red32]|uniref:type II toxin-antitoxin system RelE family toxin n=1 Tax=Geomonas sp. Red32 TaxID=2912856 RepID=UPI00202D023E|nr:cytotoxic translational repressor of toxin-antitoxin stability system [Geomonas sp. Red32]MCM0083309.1 cytotoxic translational repressor of toxin-antitoxin stability system [Geomonas sp. Red32]
MVWKVAIDKRAQKQLLKLPNRVVDILARLLMEIELLGPVRGNWPNYSKLAGDRHHCHLKKGKPTYVAVWVENKGAVTVEVIYVGTHEKAPY